MVPQITEALFRMQDPAYRDFQRRLLPTLAPETIIGVRTPALRQYAKQLLQDPALPAFLAALPHRYFDENQLHAFVLSEMKDETRCMEALERFLPYVDNWATCDQLSPRCFKRHPDALPDRIRVWLRGEAPYTIRFGIGMLMQHFLDARFDPAYPELVASLRSEEYYVNMMIAWYFATALAKQYERILPYLENRRLALWTHNKAIRKALESDRITPAQKAYLRTLKQTSDSRQNAPVRPRAAKKGEGPMWKVYCYSKCSTCRKALAWLDARGIPHTQIDLKTAPPDEETLRRLRTQSGLPLKRFFNTSGLQYRALELSKKLPQLSEAEQLALLASDGMLIKRPLAVGEDFVLVGFREAEWAEKLPAQDGK